MKPAEIQKRIEELVSGDVFLHGFSKVTIDEVARKTGISKRTLYQIFPTKDDLLFPLLDRKIASIQQEMEEIRTSSSNISTRLKKSFYLVGKEMEVVTQTFVLDIAKHYPKPWKRIEEFRNQLVATWEQDIQLGVEQRIFKEVHPTLFIIAFLHAARATMEREFLVNQPFSDEQAINQLVEIFFDGLRSSR